MVINQSIQEPDARSTTVKKKENRILNLKSKTLLSNRDRVDLELWINKHFPDFQFIYPVESRLYITFSWLRCLLLWNRYDLAFGSNRQGVLLLAVWERTDERERTAANEDKVGNAIIIPKKRATTACRRSFIKPPAVQKEYSPSFSLNNSFKEWQETHFCI